CLLYLFPMLPVSSYSQLNFLINISYTFQASSPSFLDKGSTATFTGAIAGWNLNTVLTSFSTSSSSYASQRKERATLSTPRDGSIQYGTYFSLVFGSK